MSLKLRSEKGSPLDETDHDNNIRHLAGANVTYNNVTSERPAGVTHTNNSDYPINIKVTISESRATGAYYHAKATVKEPNKDEIIVSHASGYNNTHSGESTLDALIPPHSEYTVYLKEPLYDRIVQWLEY